MEKMMASTGFTDDFRAFAKYFIWPSQALGYKVGQLKIRELRSHAEKELGQKFDLRAFPDEVLKNGALPMSVLETHIHG
jgi:uncharacterized protein (DUF885 family)